MNEQKIEGVPEGWRLVRIGRPKVGEWFLDSDNGEPLLATYDGGKRVRAIVEKIEQPKKYRPFANAKEFEPHRDRWFKMRGSCELSHRVSTHSYNDRGHYTGEIRDNWQTMFDYYEFEDGTPFGVEVTE